MKKIITIALLFLVILFLVIFFTMQRVPNEQVAMEIAQKAIEKRMPDIDINDYTLIVEYEPKNNTWVVNYISKSDPMAIGGGGPVVIIDRRTGIIISMLKQC